MTPRLESGYERENESEGAGVRGERKDLREGTEGEQYCNFNILNCISVPQFWCKVKTDFELFLIEQFLSLRKLCLTDFYFTSHDC